MADMTIDEIKAQEEQIRKEKEELKKREEEIKKARKAYQKKVNEVDKNERQIEALYKAIESGRDLKGNILVKGTDEYEKLTQELVDLEVSVREQRKELKMLQIGYEEAEANKGASKDTSQETGDAPKLTDEEKTMIAGYIKAATIDDDFIGPKTKEKQKISDAAKQTAFRKIIKLYGDKLVLNEELKEAVKNQDYGKLLESFNVDEFLKDNQIDKDLSSLSDEERLNIFKQVGADLHKGMRAFIYRKIEDVIDGLDKGQDDLNKETVLKATGKYREALTEDELQFLLKYGVDLNGIEESRDLICLAPGGEWVEEGNKDLGFRLRKLDLKDRDENKFKTKLTEDQARMLDAFEHSIQREHEKARKERANETLTAHEAVLAMSNAAANVITRAQLPISKDGKETYETKARAIVEDYAKADAYRRLLENKTRFAIKGFDLDDEQLAKLGLFVEKDNIKGRREVIKFMQNFVNEHDENLKKQGFEPGDTTVLDQAKFKLQELEMARKIIAQTNRFEAIDNCIQDIEVEPTADKLNEVSKFLDTLKLTRNVVERTSFVRESEDYDIDKALSFTGADKEQGVLVHKGALDYVIEDGGVEAQYEEGSFVDGDGKEHTRYITGFDIDGAPVYTPDVMLVKEANFTANVEMSAYDEITENEKKTTEAINKLNKQHDTFELAEEDYLEKLCKELDVEYVEETEFGDEDLSGSEAAEGPEAGSGAESDAGEDLGL